jgi:hypothetical protein
MFQMEGGRAGASPDPRFCGTHMTIRIQILRGELVYVIYGFILTYVFGEFITTVYIYARVLLYYNPRFFYIW